MTQPTLPLRQVLVILALFFCILALVRCSKNSSSRTVATQRLMQEIAEDQLELLDPGDPTFERLDLGTLRPRDLAVSSFGIDPASIGASSELLEFRTTEKKAWIDIPVDFQADKVTEIHVQLWRTRGHILPAMMWTAEVGGATIEPRGRGPKMDMHFEDTDKQFHVFKLRVDRIPSWRGSIRSLRLWPGNHPELEVKIRRIQFLYSPPLRPWYVENGSSRAGKTEIASETRLALLAESGSRYSTSLTVPERGRLSFGYGFLESGANRLAGPTVFRVTAAREGAKQTDGIPAEMVFETTLDATDDGNAGWHEKMIDLEAFAGRTVTFLFEVERAGAPATEPAYAAWSDPVLYAAPTNEARQRPTNLVLISLDTLRADYLGAYGHPVSTSPIFDRFSRENIFFESLVSQAASTGPSHMSLFLSKYPTAHGIINHERTLADEALTMAEIYRDAGYNTAAFTESGYITAGIGFDQGFSSYAEIVGPMKDRGGYVDVTFPRAMDWLDRHRDRPFLLFVQTYQCHVPYCSGPPYDELFFPEYDGILDNCLGYDQISQMNYDCIGYKLDLENHGKRPPTAADLDHVTAMYDAEIRKTDAALGRLLDHIGSLGLDDDTIVVIFSDHGEDFADHYAIGRHARSLYEEMLHVPLAIRVPGRQSGRSIAAPVRMVDLLPTLLELTEVEPPRDASFEGQSLVPLLDGGDDAAPSVFYAENYSMANRAMIREGRWKYIDTREFENPEDAERMDERSKKIRGLYLGGELYDLHDDPGETRNLIEAEPAIAAELRDRLATFLEQQERISLGSASRAVDADEEQRLRDLGYIDDDDDPAKKAKKARDGDNETGDDDDDDDATSKDG